MRGWKGDPRAGACEWKSSTHAHDRRDDRVVRVTRLQLLANYRIYAQIHSRTNHIFWYSEQRLYHSQEKALHRALTQSLVVYVVTNGRR